MEKITVYSTPTCTKCKALKEFLKENKIKFEDINVASNPDKAQEMIEKSGQMTVPVIDINGIVISGYDKKKVKEALKLTD